MSIFWAFVSWLQNVPRWAWYVLLAIAGVYWLRADARRDAKRETKQRIFNEIEEQTNDRLERARAARASVEHRASDDLNARQLDELRKRRASDPNNRL